MRNDFARRPPPRWKGKKTFGVEGRSLIVPAWLRSLFARVWYVYPAMVLTVQAPPRECLKALLMAAKPGVARLHLRNLFTEGRRYFVDPRADGFWLTSNSSILWRRRSRTTIAAVVHGTFSNVGDGGTRIALRARMRLFYIVDIFLIPAFVTSILIFAPWPKALIVVLALALFVLSWLWHRLTATLQAAEMMYFVERALEDIAPVEIPILGTSSENVITQDREFRQQWERFYREHKGEESGEVTEG